MKNKIQFAICTVIIMLCFNTCTIAQPFITNGFVNSLYGETDAPGPSGNWIRSIGIGNFSSNGDEPHSFLHVNSNYLLQPASGNINSMGEVFRTDAPNNGATYWRLLRGGTNFGTIFNNKDNHFYMEANMGDLRFNAGGSKPRMLIAANGNIGIGDYNTFFPQNQLHQHESNQTRSVYHQFTTSTTGAQANNGFLVGLKDGYGCLNIQEDMGIDFFTNTNNNNTKKMRITHSLNNVARVGIGITSDPQTHLQLGLDVYANSGYRNWMDIGLLMYGSSVPQFPNLGSDNMYVGLKNNGDDLSESIISWGDNPINTSLGDRLRFVFTASPNNGVSSNVNGLEFCRMLTVEGDNPRIGFGDMQTPNVDPQNTVEIRSSKSSPRPSGLRLTNLRSNSANDILPNGKVLTVDSNGDVVLTNDIGGGSVNSICTTQDIIARFDNTGNVIQCSDIYNNASATPNNRIGFFTTTPQYKFQAEGTALFTRNHITTPFGLTVHGQNNPPAVMIESKDDEGLSILHSATTSPNVKDLLKLYGDANKQYHLRMVGTPTGNSIVNSLTIDHEDNAGNVTHWLSFDPATNTCYMKDDYNGPVSGNHSKLYVEARTPLNYTGNNMTDAVKSVNNNTNVNTSLSNRMTGVNGECTGVRTGNNIYNIGGKFRGTGANSVSGTTRPLANNYGVSGEAFGTVLSGVNNYGGYFTSTGTGYVNCGVYSLTKNPSTFSYGIYSLAQGGTLFNYGIYSGTYNHQCSSGVNTCPKAAGFFNGEVYTTTAVYNTSDSSLKQNITPAIQSDTLLNNLSVYTFNYDTLNNYGLALQGGKHYGLLAHEVRQVLPQLVKEFIQPEEYDTAGTVLSQQKNIQAVNYTEFIPLLIAGYKSQAKEIDTLTSQLTTLQSRLDSLVMAVASCCNAPLLNQNNSNNQQTIELDNTPAIILGNDPNPFAENTTITWNIPQQDTKTITAMLVFYNQNGSILKSVKIHQAGAGSLLVYGSNLSSGQYSYSLVVNNKTVKTKRMVKVK